MIVFNQGKYKSIYAAQNNELELVKQIVAQDKQWKPSYHIAPPTGLLNDPNGLVFDGSNYHIFYQWYPYDALHGMKHWMHLITKDFQHFTYVSNLVPCQLFESHGCYSGGALLINDLVVAFYTGNTKRSNDTRIPFQNVAIFNKNGKILAKTVVLNGSPIDYTGHVRDPKPYFSNLGTIRFILGAQREDKTGTALVYELTNSKQLDGCVHHTLSGIPCFNANDQHTCHKQDESFNKQLKSAKERLGKDSEHFNLTPVDPTLAHELPQLQSQSLPTTPSIDTELLGELKVHGFDNSNVFMWECPDLLQLKDQASQEVKDLFIWSPQGLERQGRKYQNNYHNIYAIGKLEDLDFYTQAYDELDYGHDFYASQTFANTKNRTILMAWVGLPDLSYPTNKYKWHSMLSLPRELSLVNNHLYQLPIKEVYQSLFNKQTINLKAYNNVKLDNLLTSHLEIDNLSNHKYFNLELFENAQGQKIVLEYANGIFTLDRSASEKTKSMSELGDKRHLELASLDKLEVFIDNSIIEIFINDGYRTLTSRFFIDNPSNNVKSNQNIEMTIAQVKAISFTEKS